MIDLLNLTKAQLRDFIVSWEEPAYRADQIDHWLYKRLVSDFDAMTDLSLGLRERLAESARIGLPQIISEASSADGLTRKVLLQLDDGQTIETVLMLYPDAPGSPELEEPRDAPVEYKRRTVCISTQVGCPIGCPFCATGQAGFTRNLTAGEIVSQVLCVARMGSPITNVVIMGMGEPLMKFETTWEAILSMTDPTRLGLGARRITVSTSGVIPGIEQLARLDLQVNLAVSLHATDDELRNVLVPLNRKYPLRDLMHSVRSYVNLTRRRVTFEYALIDHINDQPEQARDLAQMLDGLLCHVNLIPLNPTAESSYRRPAYERVVAFERRLREAGIPTTLRVEKGIEIAAGCGQLRQVQARTRDRTNTAPV